VTITEDFDAILEMLHAIDGFAKRYVVKTYSGPEPALVVCHRADGEPVDHGWIKWEPATGRLFRDYPIGGWGAEIEGYARHLFRDVANAGNYLTSIVRTTICDARGRTSLPART